MFLDLAIGFDPVRRRCDLVYAGGGLALDTTPLTPMIVSLGSERRAEPDDELPDTVTGSSIAAGINLRRGWAGDALDPNGDRCGSRLWLPERAKLTAEVIQDVEDYAVEGLGWIERREAVEVTVAASKAGPNAILLDCAVGAFQQQFRVRVGA